MVAAHLFYSHGLCAGLKKKGSTLKSQKNKKKDKYSRIILIRLVDGEWFAKFLLKAFDINKREEEEDKKIGKDRTQTDLRKESSR